MTRKSALAFLMMCATSGCATPSSQNATNSVRPPSVPVLALQAALADFARYHPKLGCFEVSYSRSGANAVFDFFQPVPDGTLLFMPPIQCGYNMHYIISDSGEIVERRFIR